MSEDVGNGLTKLTRRFGDTDHPAELPGFGYMGEVPIVSEAAELEAELPESLQRWDGLNEPAGRVDR